MKKSVLIILGIVAAIALTIFALGKNNANKPDSLSSSTTVGTPATPPQIDQKPVPTKKPEETSTAQPVATPSTSSSATEPTDSEPIKEMHPADEGQGSIRGIVVDASSSTLVVKNETDGKQYSFLYQSAEVTGNLVVDAKVEVFYSGKLQENNSLDVYVTRIAIYPA